MKSKHGFWLLLALFVLPGCPPPPPPSPPFLSRSRAIALLNQNNSQAIGWRLRMKGTWSGSVTDHEGRRTDLSGRFVMQVAMPSGMSFVDRGDGPIPPRLEAGCNADVVWYWQKYPDDQDCMVIAPRIEAEQGPLPPSVVCFPDLPSGMPLQPQVLLDGLGLATLDDPESGAAAPRYRIAENFNQFLFDGTDAEGQPYVLKEFWLAPFAPHAVERVVYRDLDGRVVFDSKLSDHRPVPDMSLLVARRISLELPLVGSRLELRVNEVRPHADVDRDVFVDPETRALNDPGEYMPRVEWLIQPPADLAP
jgi:hypothetical protein